jgi:hypothetical protein
MTDQLWQPHEPVHLTAMWVELEKYQPYADRHGFGAEWRTMCEERTADAAQAAAWAAQAAADAADAADAAWAAQAAADAAEAAEAAAEAAARAAAWYAARAAAEAAAWYAADAGGSAMTDLNEMWTELERYQPYADKRGFGEAWKRMCEERTKTASWAAAGAAWDAAYAVKAAEWAYAAAYAAGYAVGDAAWAQQAIGKIRKAIEKEQEPEEPRVLGVLDVVRTPKGTLAVIDAADAGHYSVVLPKRLLSEGSSGEKVAWYTRDELTFVGKLEDLVERPGET